MNRQIAEQLCRTAYNRLTNYNIRKFRNSDKEIVLISDTYPGIWLEHTFDAVSLSEYDNSFIEIAKNQIEVFIDKQKEDGQLPCYVLDENNPMSKGYPSITCFSQIQECVSFAKLCFKTYQLSKDIDFLKKCYSASTAWVKWLTKNRMTLNQGLIELFCGYDSGHDNSMRFSGISCPHNFDNKNAAICPEDSIVPIIAPDMNAVFCSSLMALSEMAKILSNTKEAEIWQEKADNVKVQLFEVCYDENDNFFYDVDKNGNKRKIRSISIASLFAEHILDYDTANSIYNAHLRNPEAFWTALPFPSVAANDPCFIKNADGNSWNYYSQGLTALRTLLWMEHYKKYDDMKIVMEKWLNSQAIAHVQFGQEFDPLTAKSSACSPWYSSAMIFTLWAGYVLYGIKFKRSVE